MIGAGYVVERGQTSVGLSISLLLELEGIGSPDGCKAAICVFHMELIESVPVLIAQVLSIVLEVARCTEFVDSVENLIGVVCVLKADFQFDRVAVRL